MDNLSSHLQPAVHQRDSCGILLAPLPHKMLSAVKNQQSCCTTMLANAALLHHHLLVGSLAVGALLSESSHGLRSNPPLLCCAPVRLTVPVTKPKSDAIC